MRVGKTTNKEYGGSLEQYVVNKFEDLGIKSKRTKGSGSVNNDGDVQNSLCVVECKQRNTKDITLKEDVWKKLCGEIPLHSTKFPLYVLGNVNNHRWAVVDLDDFFHIIKTVEKISKGDTDGKS